MSLIKKDNAVTPSYWLTRFVILRLLGLVYAVAFLVAINQLIPLIGSTGLLPAKSFLRIIGETLGSRGAGFIRLPTIFWFNDSDASLLTISWTGFIVSLLVMAGLANAPMLGLLWFLYLSIVHVGQDWYGFGWEIQLLETGFLAVFLCPLLDWRPFPRRPPPLAIIWLFRWLNFRIMMGAGLIKLRGDEVWRSATALYYHFETQPIPGPLSRWFHFLPHFVLKLGVWYNYLAELIAPWFSFWPRIARHVAGIIIVFLQIFLMLSGNLSFLNWLTIIPALACFDDGFWSKLLPRKLVLMSEKARGLAVVSKPMQVTAWVVSILIAILSVNPLMNMLSSGQVMNNSFDRLELVNTYGAFGSVGLERMNVIFEGTQDDEPTDSGNWKPYNYKGLPVALDKMPPQIAPYQLRLDWQMWFASMATPEEYPWTLNLVWKLLHNDPKIVSLFDSNPFPERPPRYIRAVRYRYRFIPPGSAGGGWWKRERVAPLWLPAMSLDDPWLKGSLKNAGWIP
jgi:hypothetical protein